MPVDGVSVIVPPQQVVYRAETVEDLRERDSDDLFNGSLAFLAEFGSFFEWDATSVAVDDGFSVIRPDDRTALQAGRWLIINNDGDLNLADYGVSPTNSASVNLANFKTAVAATPIGGRLRLPPTAPLTVNIDVSGGLSSAVEIDKRIHLIIDGDLKASGGTSAAQSNPPFILNVTADDVRISGTGRVIGTGTVNDANAGTAETTPGLIRVAGDRFTLTGIEIVKPPKLGVLLYACADPRIEGVRWSGGPTVYTEGNTSYFGLYLSGVTRAQIVGNRFYPDDTGGMFVQCVFSGGACTEGLYAGNHAYRPYEKLIYIFGDRNIASNNIVVGNTGTIPGTNKSGTITNVIRFHGRDNKIDGNLTSYCAGGAQCMGLLDGGNLSIPGSGVGNQVTNNQFLMCGSTAISVYQGNVARTKVRGNLCTYGALAGFLVGDGIRVIASSDAGNVLVSGDVDVSGNTVTGFSVASAIAPIPAWTAGLAVLIGYLIRPTVDNTRYYVARTAGTTGGAEPSWNATPASITNDNGIQWEAIAFEGGQAEIKIEGGGSGKELTGLFLGNETSGGRLGISTNWVVDSKVSSSKFNSTVQGMTEANGARNRWEWNDLLGGGAAGVSGIAASSVFLNYEEGSWTPNQGAGLSVSGTYSSQGRYERIGRTVHVRGWQEATTSITISSAGVITSNLPILAADNVDAAGSLSNRGLLSPGVVTLIANNPGNRASLFGSVTSAVGRLIWSITYQAG